MSINRLFLIFLAILIGGKVLAAVIFYMLETQNSSIGLVITYLAAYYSYQTYTMQNKSLLSTDQKWQVMFAFAAIETILGGIGMYLVFDAMDMSFADFAIPTLSITAIVAFIAVFISFYFVERKFKQENEKQNAEKQEAENQENPE